MAKSSGKLFLNYAIKFRDISWGRELKTLFFYRHPQEEIAVPKIRRSSRPFL
jgi:hypothetical protein